MESSPQQDPRVYFAAERTLLAWIRTGLGLMGIGFAVSRFGLFFRELGASETHLHAKATGLSVWSGAALAGLGVIVNIAAVVRHIQLVHALASGTWVPGSISRDGILLALLLAGIGVGMTAYLIFAR